MSKNQEFIVTARKWRPLTFNSVVGQEHITTTLKNAIKTGRIHHAYLFCGPRGVGKTTTARILARAVNCLQPIDAEPCNQCTNCEAALNNRSIDIIEIDGASNNSVDDVRTLRENAKYPPSQGKYKMYIIDEVHMLSTSAFNALLKILEEPPSHLLFVFATTEAHKVPATIISRCQRFDFRRMEIPDIVYQLRNIAQKEEISIDEESLITIAKKADGSMRDSQSIFDQVIALCGKNVSYSEMAKSLHLLDEDFFFQLSEAISNKDSAKVFELSQIVISQGYEIQEVLSGLLEHFRNILTVIITQNTKLLNTSKEFEKKYLEISKKISKSDILRYIHIINNTEQAIKYLPQPRVRFELALINIAEMDKSIELKTLIEEIRQIKSGNYVVYQKIESALPAENTQPSVIVSENNNPKVEKKSVQEFLENNSSIIEEIAKLNPIFNELQNCEIEFKNNILTFKHDNKIIYQTLKRNLTELQKHLSEFVLLDAISLEVAQKQILEEIHTETQEKSSIKVDKTDDKEKHPVEMKIIDLFGAVEIK
ncbi:MAG TPA: DNA polymerase III subunit gamma/tau [Candidatus Kapabacteria bacterium]|nr:DNA polymerase III subunit gamma/tau [Candidatus Kapabacteria bacterium]HPP39745.1 DNA polymerase III subunit gamma/tau [Candidatus Kapabacteria bacterium]